jgi:alanyl-tRNA synthetase
MLNSAIADLKKRKGRVLDGRLAFKLYDTYGFPLDLVGDVAREHGLSVDEDRFQEAMREQKLRSRASWKGDDAARDDEISPLVKGLTAEGFTTSFTGYERLTAEEAKIALLIKDGRRAEMAETGDLVALAFAATPFYADSGGQAGDGGEIHFPAGLVEVHGVRKSTEVFLHYGVVAQGHFSASDKARLMVDEAGRLATARNHSATHLLHRALRHTLGEHVRQAGSLVTAERLRFDFTHSAAVGDEVIETLEKQVNEAIRRDLAVTTTVMSQDEAARAGATALFEERYGEKVRVVAMGDHSLELCGGTHVNSTGQIGAFVITGESSVAAGVRRFEALTGEGALAFIQRQRRQLTDILSILKAKPHEAVERLTRLKAQLKEQKPKETNDLSGNLAGLAVEKNGIKLLAAEVTAADPKALRLIGDELKNRLGPASLIGLAAPTEAGKVMLLAMVGPALAGRFKAGEIISRMAAEVGGQGGGRDDLAQAGGPDLAGIPAALDVFKSLLQH